MQWLWNKASSIRFRFSQISNIVKNSINGYAKLTSTVHLYTDCVWEQKA